MSQQIKKGIQNDAVDGTKIKLLNNQTLRGRNAANSADLDLLKVNTSDELEFSRLPKYSGNSLATTADVSGTVIDSIADADTTHAPSRNAVFDALALKQNTGNYVTALTGDVSASGPGSVAATVNSVGGSSASNINTATSLVNTAQSGNKVLASPSGGGSGSPAFRALVAGDIPSLPYLSSTLNSAHLYVGNGSNVATDVVVSGDLSLANTGSFTIQSGVVSNSKMANMSNNTVKANKSGISASPSDLALSDVTETGSSIFSISNGSKTVISSSNLTIQANLSSAHLYVGNSSNFPVDVAVSGDLSLANTGAFTVNTVGGSSAANINTATSLVNGAQSGNKVLASPSGGGSGAPSFRALVSADIPSLPYASSTLTSAHLYVGNGSNVATDVAVSGDISLSNAGAMTVQKIQGTTVSGTTGTGNAVFSASPTLTGTAALASATVSNKLNLVPQNPAPASPTNGDAYYDSSSNLFQFYQNGSWTSLGSGTTSTGTGSKNYLTAYTASTSSNTANTGNGDLELGLTTGFSLGNVSLTSNFPSGVPTFGSGASGNLSLSVISSGQLAQIYSLGYVSSAATTAGDFVATNAFFIDEEDKAKVMSFKFSYKAAVNPSNGNFSGTSSNSFGVAIYDVTNSAWIQPAGVFNLVQNSGTGLCNGTFQTTSNSTRYRLVVYNANASSGAITMYFDDFFVGPQTVALGSPMSDFVQYTPTFQGFGTPTSISVFYRRVGDSIHVVGSFVVGSTTAVEARISLPAGLTVDSTKIPSSRIVGEYVRDVLTSSNVSATTMLVNGGNSYMNYSSWTDSSGGLTPSNGNTFFSSGQTMSFYAEFPVTGWSSNTVVSSDTDTRVVAMQRFGTPSSSLTSSFSDVTWGTGGTFNDTHAGYSAPSYTVPVSGYYRITSALRTNGTSALNTQAQAQLLQNGSAVITDNVNAGGAVTELDLFLSGVIKCSAGDVIKIQAKSGATSPGYVSDNLGNYFMVERLSGPAIVTATESVNARYFASSTSISSSLATVSWTTKDYDSHNGMSSGTYTVPVSGKYQVDAALALSGTFALNNTNVIEIQKNGTVVSRAKVFDAAAITQTLLQISDVISCVAGDTLRIQVSSAGTGPAIVSSNFENYISLSRVGN